MNTIKKLSCIFLSLLLFFLQSVAFGAAENAEPDGIESFRDIPGITPEEIAEIEKIRANYTSFTHGHINDAESYLIDDGTFTGFKYALSNLLTELFGIQFIPVHYDSWAMLLEDFDNMVLDFDGNLTPTPERTEKYHMSHAIAERAHKVFYNPDFNDIETEYDLRGKRVAFLPNSATEQATQDAYPVDFMPLQVDSFEKAAQLIRIGEIDAFVVEAPAETNFAGYDFIASKELFSLVYAPITLSTANPELEVIISVLNKYLVAGGIDKVDKLYSDEHYKYMKYLLRQSFTPEEVYYLETLKNGKTVNVAFEHDNYPVSFYNEKDGEFQGIAIDVLNEMSELLGIEFTSTSKKDSTWAELYEGLLNGEYAMVTELIKTDVREGEGGFLWPNKPYSTSNCALLSKIDYPNLSVHKVVRANVGYLEDSAYEDIYKKWFPENDNAIALSSQFEGFDKLESGEIDLLMGTDHLLLTLLNYLEKPGYKINIMFNEPIKAYFGFNKDEELLLSVIEKAQACISTNDIRLAWENKVFDYSKKLGDMHIMYTTIIAAVLFSILIIVLLFLLKNRGLNNYIKKQTAMLCAIYTSIPDLVYCKDLDNRFTSCNPSFEEYTGLCEKRLIGKRDSDVFFGDSLETDLSAVCDMSVIEYNKTLVKEELLVYPDGSKRLMETIRTPLIQDGSTVGMIGISRDITDRKAAEQALKVASNAKSAFFANMSHEIRTPLNAIIGIAGLMKKSRADDERYYSSVNQIISSSNHLLGIVNDILDMSKIESGKMELTLEPFRLMNAYDEVESIISPRCREKSIAFIRETGEIENAVLIGDRLRIKQVLINLLGNAVKFTDEKGEIKFSVNVIEETETNMRLKFTIADNGIGISEKHQEKLFLPFEQVANSAHKLNKGTGLGLSISQNLIKMMNSEIKVESKLNEGTRFYFELTLEKSKEIPREHDAEIPADFSGKHMLIVEDVDINRFIITENLKDTGIIIDEAENGKIAVELFKESHEGYYDIILMDVQMPELDGYGATGQIRALPRSDAKKIPIVAMTANAYKEDVEKAMSAGMNAHLSKPVNISLMLSTLKNYLK